MYTKLYSKFYTGDFPRGDNLYNFFFTSYLICGNKKYNYAGEFYNLLEEPIFRSYDHSIEYDTHNFARLLHYFQLNDSIRLCRGINTYISIHVVHYYSLPIDQFPLKRSPFNKISWIAKKTVIVTVKTANNSVYVMIV